jgi:putative oxidoreductase
MNYLQRLEYWGDRHHPKWVDIIRIALGIFLCYKGFEFLNNMSTMLTLMSRNMSFGSFTLVLLGHYIVFAHLVGGFLLAIGVLTRFACLIQIPILIGAIIFINTSPDMWQPFSELLISILVLVLLIYFLIAGNGQWSFSDYLYGEQKEKSQSVHT